MQNLFARYVAGDKEVQTGLRVKAGAFCSQMQHLASATMRLIKGNAFCSQMQHLAHAVSRQTRRSKRFRFDTVRSEMLWKEWHSRQELLLPDECFFVRCYFREQVTLKLPLPVTVRVRQAIWQE